MVDRSCGPGHLRKWLEIVRPVRHLARPLILFLPDHRLRRGHWSISAGGRPWSFCLLAPLPPSMSSSSIALTFLHALLACSQRGANPLVGDGNLTMARVTDAGSGGQEQQQPAHGHCSKGQRKRVLRQQRRHQRSISCASLRHERGWSARPSIFAATTCKARTMSPGRQGKRAVGCRLASRRPGEPEPEPVEEDR